ncbi:hypothetical protein ZHAS_00012474 [Anopheles sinensis]|uniref:Uncharacterized protein n=1 Tax=Anopheles sinensis TaxID=74873 RepID=A0A084W2U5_ANOSI|nr:hypothetical protein ZHAS_00012474 [Anopheles sinensis]
MQAKYEELLTSMNGLKERIGTDSKHDAREESNLIIWQSVYRSLEAILDRIRVNQLKAQQLHEPAQEKDLINIMKVMALIDAILADTSKMPEDAKQNSPSFADQMVSLKQNMDLVSLELTKIKTVNETLANVVSNYNLELAVANSENENDEDGRDHENDDFVDQING